MRGPLSPEQVCAARAAMKPPALALLPKNTANERQLFSRRGAADFVAGSDQALCFGQLCAAIVMNCGERFAFFYGVADAFVEFEADGVVDGVFLFFAATAQHGQGVPQLFAICCGDEARERAGDFGVRARLRQELRLVDHAIVPALKANALPEFILGLAGG